MKKSILTFVLFMSFHSFAQLKGSGKTITKTYDYQNFNTVLCNDLDGKLEIQVGKPFSITAIIDDNLSSLLTIIEHAGDKKLSISIKGNQNNKMYIEDTKIKIIITMPYLLEVTNNGNSDLLVSNINSNLNSINNLV